MLDEDILNIARKAWRKRDYNAARDFYQQVAYGYNNFTEPEKEAFTKEVSIFAGEDPMYREILKLVISQIMLEKEPLLQSKLTNIVKQDHGERGVELLRYVLYYADYRGEIIRKKAGRSYILELPKTLSFIENTSKSEPIEDSEEPLSIIQALKTGINKAKNEPTKPSDIIGLIIFLAIIWGGYKIFS